MSSISVGQGPPPTMPSAAPPVEASPSDVGLRAHVTTVGIVHAFLQWCRVAIDSFETYMAQSSPADQEHIYVRLSELAEKVKQGEHVKAMPEVSLEARKGEGGPWVII